MFKLFKSKTKKIKNIENFFIKLFSKFDYFYTFPQKGFNRSNTDKFMDKHFLNINNFGLNVLDIEAGEKPYKKYFLNSNYESCDSQDALNDINISPNQQHTFYCDIKKKYLEKKIPMTLLFEMRFLSI